MKLFYVISLPIFILAASAITNAAYAQSALEDSIYKKVDIVPQYPGGAKAWSMFIAKNFKYPPMAQRYGVSGKVQLSFIIEKNGALSNVQIVRDLGYGTGAEAARVLKLSPLWSPGMQDGRPVRVSYVMPIALNFTAETTIR